MTKIKASIVEEDLKGVPNVYAIGYLDALERAGVEVVDDGTKVSPDPEPTNAERLEQMWSDWERLPFSDGTTFFEYLDRQGVTAPGAKDN